MRHRSVSRRYFSLSLALGALLASCSSGGGGGSGSGFQLTRVSLLDGAVWKVNQEIVFTFSDEVDFSSVSSNTISIQTDSGTPATGTFFSRGTNQIVFQPTCPTRDDLSDTGLIAGGVHYVIRVLGNSSGAANTVRSTSGVALDTTQVRNFTTDEVDSAFLDTQQGPPVPVLITSAQCQTDAPGTYLEIGGDPDARVYFLPDDEIPPLAGEDQDGDGLIDDADGDGLDDDNEPELCDQSLRAPLNLYSLDASKIAFVIEFNQALHPAASNISSNRMHLEFLDGLVWTPVETKVTLVANCTETGARVRLEPLGIVPPSSRIRAVVDVGLEDLSRNPTGAANNNFAITPTQSVDFSSLIPADTLSDEFLESFDFGGTSPLSFQDTQALSDSPPAKWSGGRLTAGFAFEGTGGPGGTFDWLVQDGDSIVVDTVDGAILGADGVTTQLLQDGTIDLRNMTIEEGGEVRVQSSSGDSIPLRINATGTVIIRGILDVSGFDARDVSSVNTGDEKEVGGEGGPGGGRGGNANEVVTNSSTRGGFGQGPNNLVNSGGQGGETGYASPQLTKDARRPGGGAGGRFADSLVAQNGRPGADLATGAVPPNSQPPAGGLLSPGPFVDGNVNNDFFGSKAVGTSANVIALIHGELPSLWGGYGGGGGGNADPATLFPTPNWTPASDEKGGAGGGGGGGLVIRALGPIQFGRNGQIRCDGGRGGIGENVLVQDHIGGNGGSGSGGHVLLETASYVDFTDGLGAASGFPSRDWIRALGGPQVKGTLTPGDVSYGGAGGPGVIQIHVPQSLTPPSGSSVTSDIVVPQAALVSGNPIDAVTSPQAAVLVPAFGSHSVARSKWITIGRADRKPGGVISTLQFLFGGTQTAPGNDEGKILVSDVDGDGDQDDVQPLAALLDDDLEGNTDVAVLPDRVTLRIQGGSLSAFSGSNDLYLRNPSLLENFVLRLSVAEDPDTFEDFVVASGAYGEGAAGLGDERLDVTVAEENGDLQDFIIANTALGTIHYSLIPRFFRVVTGGVEGSLPSTAFVRIRFEGARDDGTGSPDEANPVVPFTGDINAFNALAPGDLQFFRFDVEFDLGPQVSADTQAVSLDFLRIPFVF